jgi:hypothetical protein
MPSTLTIVLFIKWVPLNVIMVYVISQIILSHQAVLTMSCKMRSWLLQWNKEFGLCFHSQSDHIKQELL